MKRVEDERVVRPLSPLLANLLLNEVDQELEKRGFAFCRYADDCNVHVRSKRATEDAMQTMGKLMDKLKLNQEKSAVAKAWERKFLGYRLWIAPKRIVKRAVAPQALAKFKQRVRELTSRSCGQSMEQIVERLADTPAIFSNLDSWIRRRLRMIYLKQWKRRGTAQREMVSRGLSLKAATSIASLYQRYWRMAGTSGGVGGTGAG